MKDEIKTMLRCVAAAEGLDAQLAEEYATIGACAARIDDLLARRDLQHGQYVKACRVLVARRAEEIEVGTPVVALVGYPNPGPTDLPFAPVSGRLVEKWNGMFAVEPERDIEAELARSIGALFANNLLIIPAEQVHPADSDADQWPSFPVLHRPQPVPPQPVSQ